MKKNNEKTSSKKQDKVWGIEALQGGRWTTGRMNNRQASKYYVYAPRASQQSLTN